MASLIAGAKPPTIQLQALNLSSRFSSSCEYSALSVPVRQFATPTSVPLVYCGRGDLKTAKGKRFNHSFGNARPRNKNKGKGPPRVPFPPSAPKKDKFEDVEVIKIDIDED